MAPPALSPSRGSDEAATSTDTSSSTGSGQWSFATALVVGPAWQRWTHPEKTERSRLGCSNMVSAFLLLELPCLCWSV